ncbi:Hypothetical predicted protein [Mytilus galloprovincialis]|uniref:Immunoglobulin domain-containing protein n=1 Tax=Mytilus galloprovincialis TaxID=29158 RepID=A0A8B6HAG5_MYTGA|nr:Hypothetical predicted protein [Mytilus galloprovincialis]
METKTLNIIHLLIILFILSSIAGIGNDTTNIKVQKGATAVFKCSRSGSGVTWLGPDINNTIQNYVVYFSNNKKNPKLNQAKYSFKENKGGYELVIKNFQKGNIGFYICRLNNDGHFYETKYNVSIEVPINQQGNKEQNLVILLLMIPVVLLGGSITIVGVLKRVKGTSIEQHNTAENQMYQNSNVPPNGRSSETEIPFPDRTNPDADLGVSVETGATSNYRNNDESTAVKLFCKSLFLLKTNGVIAFTNFDTITSYLA